MMKAVITGGAGFIGSHIAQKLVRMGYEVTIVDDLSTGDLFRVPSQCRFEFGSILDLPLLGSYTNADVIFHYAAISSISKSIKDPITTNQVNIAGTLNVLSAAVKGGVREVLFASSGQVYGDGLHREETMHPTPLSPYTLSKLVGEHYCRLFSELHGLKTVCLRYFNVYGDGQNPRSEYALAVPVFRDRAARGLPLPIYGDGEQTRDFIFIDDAVDASIYAVESGMEGVYNVGTGVATSINELASIIGGGCQLTYSERKLGEARDNSADISKLNLAGFTPRWTLKEGLLETERREKTVATNRMATP